MQHAAPHLHHMRMAELIAYRPAHEHIHNAALLDEMPAILTVDAQLSLLQMPSHSRAAPANTGRLTRRR